MLSASLEKEIVLTTPKSACVDDIDRPVTPVRNEERVSLWNVRHAMRFVEARCRPGQATGGKVHDEHRVIAESRDEKPFPLHIDVKVVDPSGNILNLNRLNQGMDCLICSGSGRGSRLRRKRSERHEHDP